MRTSLMIKMKSEAFSDKEDNLWHQVKNIMIHAWIYDAKGL
jgi:hypothetical protein